MRILDGQPPMNWAFGIGWSITGLCPGPVFVNIGEGKVYALFAFAGVIVGTWLGGRLHPWLAGAIALPEVPRG